MFVLFVVLRSGTRKPRRGRSVVGRGTVEIGVSPGRRSVSEEGRRLVDDRPIVEEAEFVLFNLLKKFFAAFGLRFVSIYLSLGEAKMTTCATLCFHCVIDVAEAWPGRLADFHKCEGSRISCRSSL